MAMVPAVSGIEMVSAITTTAPVVASVYPEPSSTLVVLISAETSATAESTIVVALTVVSASEIKTLRIIFQQKKSEKARTLPCYDV